MTAEDEMPASPTKEDLIAVTIAEIKQESARYGKMEKLPWVSTKDGKITWSQERIAIAKVMRSQNFEFLMGVVIIFNLILILVEADKEAECYPVYAKNLDDCPTSSGAPSLRWIAVSNWILQVLYTVEAIVAIYAQRSTYFHNGFNCLDFFVVASGWASILFADIIGGFSPAFLRIFRVVRLLRAFRIILAIRECYMLISGLAGSIRAMFFGTMLLLGMLFFWSIILVSFAHEVNVSEVVLEFYTEGGCERCPRAYESVYASMVTLFQQIVAGDSWGATSLPVIEYGPPWMVLLFMMIVMSVSLGVMNLILAVIVDSATEARENDLERKQTEKQKQLLEMKITLLKLCSSMDEDGSGTLTLEELKKAWDTSDEFRSAMITMEIGENELANVFKIINADGSEDLDYREFVDQLYELKTADQRMSMALIHSDVSQTMRTLDDIKPVMDQVEKHEKMLNYHNQMLEAIDTKLSMLLLVRNNAAAAASTGGSLCSGPAATAQVSTPGLASAYI